MDAPRRSHNLLRRQFDHSFNRSVGPLQELSHLQRLLGQLLQGDLSMDWLNSSREIYYHNEPLSLRRLATQTRL